MKRRDFGFFCVGFGIPVLIFNGFFLLIKLPFVNDVGWAIVVFKMVNLAPYEFFVSILLIVSGIAIILKNKKSL